LQGPWRGVGRRCLVKHGKRNPEATRNIQCPRLLPQSPSHQSKNITHDPPKLSGRRDATRTDFLQRRLHKQGALLLLRVCNNNNKLAKIERQQSFVVSRVFCLNIRKNNQNVHPRRNKASARRTACLTTYTGNWWQRKITSLFDTCE
jgi:hypothetical protein